MLFVPPVLLPPLVSFLVLLVVTYVIKIEYVMELKMDTI